MIAALLFPLSGSAGTPAPVLKPELDRAAAATLEATRLRTIGSAMVVQSFSRERR